MIIIDNFIVCVTFAGRHVTFTGVSATFTGILCDVYRNIMRRLQGASDVYRLGDEFLLQEKILMRSTFPQVTGMNVTTFNGARFIN